MLQFILRRLLLLIPVLLGLITIVFILLYILPGDPARLIAGPSATPQIVETIRKQNGLDQPLWVQYFNYLSHVIQGDLGRSYQSHRTILTELDSVVPKTIQLALTAEVFSSILGITLGVIAASLQDTSIDRLITTLAAVQLSFPLFWLALMLQILFSVNLHLLPPSGYNSGFDQYIILPTITLAIPSSGILARMTRTTILEVLNEDYIRTAYAKGLYKRAVLWKHALRNALIPLTTTIGLDLTRLLGGVVIIEVIYGWPGLGKYAYDALVYKDLPALQASIMVIAICVSLVNLFVDILYGILDPRIRYSR